MLLKRKGIPEENEVVICTVKDIKRQSVFVDMDEYKNSQAVISISEVSPGRIRNIRDFVQVDKKVFCKVLRVDKERSQVDLSLRRVNQKDRIDKNTELRKESLAETILKLASVEFKFNLEEFYNKKLEKVMDDYYYLHEFFEDWLLNEETFDKYNIKVDSNIKEFIFDMITKRFKKPLIEVKYQLKITSENSDGLNLIRNPILKYLEKDSGIEVVYLGGGKYQAKVIGENFKTEESRIKNFIRDIGLEYESTKVALSAEKIE